MTTSDGTQWTADIGDAVPDYTFTDSDRVVFIKTKNADEYGTLLPQDIVQYIINEDFDGVSIG